MSKLSIITILIGFLSSTVLLKAENVYDLFATGQKEEAINILKNIDGYRYWDQEKNTKLNQTIGFLNRKLDFKSLHKLKDEEIKQIVDI